MDLTKKNEHIKFSATNNNCVNTQRKNREIQPINCTTQFNLVKNTRPKEEKILSLPSVDAREAMRHTQYKIQKFRFNIDMRNIIFFM